MKTIPYLHPKLPFRVGVGESGLDLAQFVIQRSSRKYRHLHTEDVSLFSYCKMFQIRIRFTD